MGKIYKKLYNNNRYNNGIKFCSNLCNMTYKNDSHLMIKLNQNAKLYALLFKDY